MTTPAKLLCALALTFSCSVHAQTASAAAPAENEFSEKKAETKFTEVITTDSLPASELLKRAVSWIKNDNTKYKKSSGQTTTTKAECLATFPVQPKELNPRVDYTGKIAMKVVIECKDSKFRYVVSDIRHISKNGHTSAGSIDNKVPECGSMTMDDLVWKKLRGEALRHASTVIKDIKASMAQQVSEGDTDEW